MLSVWNGVMFAGIPVLIAGLAGWLVRDIKSENLILAVGTIVALLHAPWFWWLGAWPKVFLSWDTGGLLLMTVVLFFVVLAVGGTNPDTHSKYEGGGVGGD